MSVSSSSSSSSLSQSLGSCCHSDGLKRCDGTQGCSRTLSESDSIESLLMSAVGTVGIEGDDVDRDGMGSMWVEVRGEWHDEACLPAGYSQYIYYISARQPAPGIVETLHAERQRNGQNGGGKPIRQSGSPGMGPGMAEGDAIRDWMRASLFGRRAAAMAHGEL